MDRKKEFYLGIFIFSAIIILIFILFYFDKINIKTNYYTIKVQFSDASNLTNGVPVLVGGVNIGSVEEIYVKNNNAIVRLRIKNEIKIKKGALITLSMKGIIGDMVVNIYNPEGDADYYEEGDLIIGKDPISVNQIMEDLYSTMKIVEVLGNNITEISSNDMGKALENMNTLAVTMNDTLLKTNDLIDTNKYDLNRALYNAGITLSSANKIIEENRQSISDLIDNSNHLIKEMEDILIERNKEFRDALYGTIQLLSETRALLNDNSGKIIEVVDNLGKISDKTSKLLNEFDENEINDFKEEIKTITEGSQQVLASIKASISGEGSEQLKQSIENSEKITNNINKIIDNEITGEVGLLLNSNNELRLNAGLEIFNNQKKFFLKLENSYFDEIFEGTNIFVGRYFSDNKLGIGVIRGKPGLVYGYRFSDSITGGFQYSDFENNIVILKGDFVYEKIKLELNYKLDEDIAIGLGYRF